MQALAAVLAAVRNFKLLANKTIHVFAHMASVGSTLALFLCQPSAEHLSRFGALLARWLASGCGASSPSSCLSFGSLLATLLRQSATRHQPGVIAKLGVAASRNAGSPQSWLRHHCPASYAIWAVAKQSKRLANSLEISKGASAMQHCCSSNHGQVAVCSHTFHYAPQPNWSVNADATMGHAFGMFMAHGCALRPSASGAGYLGR